MQKLPLVLSLIAVAGLSHADLRSELLAMRAKQEKAAKAKDIRATEAIVKDSLAPDFHYMQDGKPQNAKTFVEGFVSTLESMEKITAQSTRIITLKQTGNTGSGLIELGMKGTMKTPDKKAHLIDWTGEFNEEFKKVGGKWKISTMTAGKQKFLMDGKPVKM